MRFGRGFVLHMAAVAAKNWLSLNSVNELSVGTSARAIAADRETRENHVRVCDWNWPVVCSSGHYCGTHVAAHLVCVVDFNGMFVVFVVIVVVAVILMASKPA